MAEGAVVNIGRQWEGIVFDLDGTLLDSQGNGLERFTNVARSLGLLVSETILAEVKALWGVPGHVLVEHCWPDVRVQDFMHQWETFDCENALPIFSGVREVVERLSPCVLLSILTSRSWSTRLQLRHNGLEPFFSFVCTIDDCAAPKPDPRSIEPLLAQYAVRGIERKDIVLVGDSVRSDYGLAAAMGMDFIAVTWGNNSREDFLAAGLDECYIIDTVEDLPRRICAKKPK